MVRKIPRRMARVIAAALLGVSCTVARSIADAPVPAYQQPPIQGYNGAKRPGTDTAILMGAYWEDSDGGLSVVHIETLDGSSVEAPSSAQAQQRRIAVLPGPHVLAVTFYSSCRACRHGSVASVSPEQVRIETEPNHAYEVYPELRNTAHDRGAFGGHPEARTTDDGFRWAPTCEEITGTARAWGVDAVGKPLPKELLRDGQDSQMRSLTEPLHPTRTKAHAGER